MRASICVVNERILEKLPGSEIVLPGLADLNAGRSSINSLAVQAAAPRLRALGLEIGESESETPAAHQLYDLLHRDLGDGAHSRYNAILTRLTSFARAAERERRAVEDL